MKEYRIGVNDAGQRLDKFLLKAARSLPPSLLYRGIRLKRIKRNGKRCRPNDILEEGDLLTLYLNDDVFPEEGQLSFLASPARVSALYEDENLLLVDKPAGLVVHEDDENSPDTLIGRVRHYLYEKGEYHPDQENSFAPSLCNRIDRNTCGIVIVAKNAETLRILNRKIRDREIEKRYLCLVRGAMPKEHDILTAYLKKDEREKKVDLSPVPKPGYKTIRTEYRVLEGNGSSSLIEINLLTGRTHQIRAHLAFLGHPILGDGKYGISREDRKQGFRYQALCSYRLIFRFATDAGILSYLDGRSFTVENVWFRDRDRISDQGTASEGPSDESRSR